MSDIDEKRTQTRARVLQLVKSMRMCEELQLGTRYPDDDRYGAKVEHIPIVFAACTDDEALVSFLTAFVGEWRRLYSVSVFDGALVVSVTDDESLCAWCGWPLKETVQEGCIRGNCSIRPYPERARWPERAAREAERFVRPCVHPQGNILRKDEYDLCCCGAKSVDGVNWELPR